MGRSYRSLSLEDRCEIARLQANGRSIRQIAAALDRAPSTIARELKRNGGRRSATSRATPMSRPGAALDGLAARTRSRAARAVLGRLQRGWSPEQVAGRLAREAGAPVISHETHLPLHLRPDRPHQRLSLAALPAARQEQARLARPQGRQPGPLHPAAFPSPNGPRRRRPQRPRPLGSRPHALRQYGQAILTLHERQSRADPRHPAAQQGRSSRSPALIDLFPRCLHRLRQTVTFDNGTEFARHYELHPLAIDTFFCDPHAPWQKGGIENAIGRMRRFIPRKTDLATLPDATSQPHRRLQQHPAKMP